MGRGEGTVDRKRGGDRVGEGTVDGERGGDS